MIQTLLVLTFFLGLEQQAVSQTLPVAYKDRDGKKEAQVAASGSAPWKLYTSYFGGRVPMFIMPGLLNCSLDQNNVHVLALPEGAWQEGVRYTADEDSAQYYALRFAKSYNRETMRLRNIEIRKVCPKIKIEPQ